LQKLYQIVDLHWAEICDSLPIIEALSEEDSFPASDLAAAVASKCFFHLQEYNEALRLALSAGPYFDILSKNEYIEVLLAKCIDEYTAQRRRLETEPELVIDPRMENIIEQMFQRCYKDSCYEQAIGVALDTRRLDKVEEVCTTAILAGRESILGYAFNLCQVCTI
jgi:26S proteasome regulatory subunit N2